MDEVVAGTVELRGVEVVDARVDGVAQQGEQIARDADVGIGTPLPALPHARGAGRGAAWMDRFADYVAAKREMADALRAVFAAGAVTVSEAREQLTAAVQTILDAGIAAGTLRDDVRADDIVATIVGMFTATSLAGGQEQLERMFDLLMNAVRPPRDQDLGAGRRG